MKLSGVAFVTANKDCPELRNFEWSKLLHLCLHSYTRVFLCLSDYEVYGVFSNAEAALY